MSGAPETATQESVASKLGDARQLRYLSQPEVLEEVGPPKLLRMVLLCLALTVFGGLGWAGVAQIKEAVKATGEVIPIGSVYAVQHLEGGIIAEILVDDGQLVEAGQVLVRLQPTRALADLEAMQVRRTGLALKALRLRAFANGEDPDFGEVPAKYQRLARDELEAHRQQRRAAAEQQRVLELKVEQRTADLAVLLSEKAKLAQEVKYLSDEEQLQKQMLDRGLISSLTYLNTQRELNANVGELNEVEGKIESERRAIAEAEAKLTEFVETQRDDTLAELGAITAELAEVQEAIVQLSDRVRRLDVIAPVRGLVQEFETKTVGGVIQPGGAILKIVPADEELIVEARVSPIDVGHVSPGDRAEVKISTFDFARFGAIDGVVERISPTTFKDPDGSVYYKAMVRLAQAHVGEDPTQNPVLPGMVTEIDIIGDERSVLEYLLRPVYESLDKALSER